MNDPVLALTQHFLLQSVTAWRLSELKPQLLDRRCDKVLPRQDYGTITISMGKQRELGERHH